MKTKWLLCPVCGNKTRDRIRKDTVLKNYPLYCPKCKQESYIASLSMRKLYDERGNAYYGVDEDIRERLQTKLMRAILIFRAD